MRLFKLLSLLSLFFWARASSLKTRYPASHPLDVRQLDNVCASVQTELIVTDVNNPDASGLFDAGAVDSCLCTSTLQDFIQSDPIASSAVSKADGGEQEVIDSLTAVIIITSLDSNCPTHPDHSSPACVDNNPCGFTCTDGFTPFPPGNPETCACKGDSVICNGQSAKKKRWVGSGICAEMGPEWAACGVFGGAARAWECINTARDLESCGGCMLPLTPYTPIGRDCTSLPGVADVACMAGECVVQRCLPGYSVARDGNHCVSKHGKHSEYDEDEADSVPVRVYGFEHISLQKRKH
ncbi:hypothetical protein BGW80DRAFT_1225325 [Lactifluus volemus]|nr:hypothetical protein BGW80DRAFT_1225325 [Lactifluus volemus]